MKIGVYGGTFDPPHLGHQAAAQAAKAMGFDQLILVPAKLPPHKALADDAAGAEHRLAMTALMADALGVQVDDLELRREGKSYTADTLQELKERRPDADLWLLMGSDMFLTVQNWYQPQVIFSLAGICAFSRNGKEDMPALCEHARRLREDYGARIEIFRLDGGEKIASSAIRRTLAQGRRPEGLSDAVYGYILLNNLYGAKPDLRHLPDDDLRACSLSMVYAKRHAHIRGVEEEAVRLAQRWNADVKSARRAGILHDCTKYWPMERHLAYCAEYGLSLDALELKSEKLLHSKTGALVARHVFGESDAVYDAIYCHTTGKADMTTLDKIIYIADYMEPNRDFPGVERLRAIAYEDLDAAVALGCEMSIKEMREKGREVHPNTCAALASLTDRKGMEP